ncbi:10441_t:CDS:2, partial [Funneliformis caledonium]
EFARLFGKDKCKKKVVLFIDEYDVLYEADDDIRALHAGLVCLCGRAIYVDLMRKLDERRRLDFLTWLNFTINSLQKLVLDYATFRKMIVDNEERNLAEFLTAKGVLIRDEETKDRFKMSSALVDELLRERVIPELFKSTPTVAVPEKCDGFLDIVNVLKTSAAILSETQTDNI